MKQKIALIIYDNMSMFEIGPLMYLFRWSYQTEFVTFASEMVSIKTEEGIIIQPEKVFNDFDMNDYDALILSGCSDFAATLSNHKLFRLLKTIPSDTTFPIGAIGSAPIFLAKAGLLDQKRFTSSSFVQIHELFDFIPEENIEYAPLVIDQNIVTAQGSYPIDFAIAMEKSLGYEVSASASYFPRAPKEWEPKDFMYYLEDEQLEEVKEIFHEYITDNIQ